MQFPVSRIHREHMFMFAEGAGGRNFIIELRANAHL